MAAHGSGEAASVTAGSPWTALVTGGASGIGGAVVRKLASRSVNVLIADRNEEWGEELAKTVQREFNVDCVFRKVDVSREEDIKGMVAAVVERWGRLDYAANVAGICEPAHDSEEHITEKTVTDTFAINQRGTWLCQKYEAEQMARQLPRPVDVSPAPALTIRGQRGSIVNVASTTAHTGMGFAAYAPTKHAILAITRNGAKFYGPHGIRCNSISPGGTSTPMSRAAMKKIEGVSYDSDEDWAPFAGHVPLRVFARAEEQANVISFLLSPESSHVNAVDIPVDGGFTHTR